MGFNIHSSAHSAGGIESPFQPSDQGKKVGAKPLSFVEGVIKAIRSACSAVIGRGRIPPDSQAVVGSPTSLVSSAIASVRKGISTKPSSISSSISTPEVESQVKSSKGIAKFEQTNESSQIKDAFEEIKEVTGNYIENGTITCKDIVTKDGEIDGKPCVINIFPPGSYNGVKTEDYTNRAKLLTDSLSKMLKECPEDYRPVARGHARDGISKLHDKLEENIAAECKIDPNSSEFAKDFKEIHEKASLLLANYANDLVREVKKVDPTFNLKNLAQLEKDFVRAEQRPIIVNFYQTTEGSPVFVSMQRPATESGKTIPSTQRDVPGLCNYVTTTFAKLDTEGKPEVLFHGVRRSCLPPIAIKDRLKRQQETVENCRQEIVDQAGRLFDKDKAELKDGDVITVPVRQMMLFTAKVFDGVRNYSIPGRKWKGESETTQLTESAKALSLFRDQEIDAVVHGKSVKIKVDMSYMSLGANAGAAGIGLGKLPPSAIQDKVNFQGLEEFHQDQIGHLRQMVKGDSRLERLHNEYNSFLNSGGVALARDKLDKVKKEFAPKLSEKRQALLEAYGKDSPDKTEIRKLTKEIEKLENKLASAYKNLQTIKKQTFQLTGENGQPKIDNYEGKIKEALNKTSLPDETKTFYLNFMEAQHIFFEKKYETPEAVMEFQVLYLQQQQEMGRIPTWNCKSGEDRTGRLNDILEEREIYRSENQDYPRGAEAKTQIDQTIAPKVNQFSASGDNTFHNSGAKGLQIGKKVNPQSILPGARKAMAGLAKGVFKKASKLAP